MPLGPPWASRGVPQAPRRLSLVVRGAPLGYLWGPLGPLEGRPRSLGAPLGPFEGAPQEPRSSPKGRIAEDGCRPPGRPAGLPGGRTSRRRGSVSDLKSETRIRFGPEIRNAKSENPKQKAPGRYAGFPGDTRLSRAIRGSPGSFADWASFRKCAFRISGPKRIRVSDFRSETDPRFGFRIRNADPKRRAPGSFAALPAHSRLSRLIRGSP